MGACSSQNQRIAMEEDQKLTVEQSWKMIGDIGLEEVGVATFKTLFEEYSPEMLQVWSFRNEKNLYESEALKWHGFNVMHHIGTAVVGLRKPEAVMRQIVHLGKMHNNFNIQRWHFDKLGLALIATLQRVLGTGFTGKVKEAWIRMYGIIAEILMSQITTCQKWYIGFGKK